MDDYEKEEAKELIRAARKRIARIQHHLDQLSAKCRDENRSPTDEEWAALEETLG